jgi:PAS domain S-box-containing protein
MEQISQKKFSNSVEFLNFSVECMIDLLDSKIGYIYRYNEDDQEFILHTWSKNVMFQCSVQDPQLKYQLTKTGCWGDVIRTRKPVIINNFNEREQHIPAGHIRLKNFLAIPIFSNGHIVATAGVANKEADYTDDDVEQLEEFVMLAWHIQELRTKEEELNKSLLTLEQALSLTKAGVWSFNTITNKFHAADIVKDIYGFSVNEEELNAEKVQSARLKEYEYLTDSLTELINQDKPYDYEFKIQRTNGEIRDIHSMAVYDKETKIVYGVIQDITSRKKIEAALESELKKKDFLFKEVHHRIKNNLQTTISLLSLPMSDIRDERALDIFEETIHRIQVIAITHQNLYKRSLESNDVKIMPYLKEIGDSLLVGINNIQIEFVIPDDFSLEMQFATPFGLIINELITNSIKYAFPNSSGIISITIINDGNTINLTYKDNGIGKPSNSKNGLGSTLIESLCFQCGGKGYYDYAFSGTKFIFQFQKN